LRCNSTVISLIPAKCLGFQVATVTLHARQIQKQASLGLIDEMTIRQFPAEQAY
jgi:hypothetical protein